MPIPVSRPVVRSCALFGLLLLGAAGARPSWTQSLGPSPLRPPAAAYTITDLGTVPNGTASAALALNATGEVTGYAVTGTESHAFVWDRARGMVDLGTLPGDAQSYGTGINVKGEVCGISHGSGSHAFVWSEEGGMRALAPLATGRDTWAFGLNAAGQVAGMSSYLGRGGKRCFGAVVWDASGSVQLLPVLDPSLVNTPAAATAINDAGQATGYQGIREFGFRRSQPFVWDPTNGLKLLARPTGTSGRPLANNAVGRVLGLSGAQQAFPVTWAPTGRKTLLDGVHTLAGAGLFQQELGGINSAGEMVYSLSTRKGWVATLFRGGTAVDLNRLADSGAAHLYTAAAINESGQIVGAFKNTDGTRSHAYLLTPRQSTNAVLASAAVSPVNLGTAGNFAILSKAGITTTGVTRIVGNIGVSPIASTAMTGFGLTMDSSGQFSRSTLVTGQVFAADYAVPTPSMLGTAVSNMLTAYSDAAGRMNPTATELGAGNIGGKVIGPGLYKWSSSVSIPADVTLSGPSNGVWIFQIAGTLNISSGKRVLLSGGAQPSNIFWQVAGQTTLGTTSVLNGNILGKTAIAIMTGATLNGRALAQTAVTLDANAITRPSVPVTLPAAPTNLTATATNSTTVALAWRDASNNEQGFKIERKLGFGAYSVVATTTANSTTYTDVNCAANAQYYYRVRAFNSAGYSGYSNSPGVYTLGVPSGLTALATNSTTVALTWVDASNNEQGFKIERRIGLGAYSVVATGAVNSLTYTNVSLTPNTQYYYRVRAFNSGGYSGYSNSPGVYTLGAPTGLTAIPVSKSQINLAWKDNSPSDTGFKIERERSGLWALIAPVSTGTTTYSNVGLTASTAYKYRVRAISTGSNSTDSNIVSVSTPAS